MSRRKITGSEKNVLTAGVALLFVLLSFSCGEEPWRESCPPGNSLYIASTILAPVPRVGTEVATRLAGDDAPVTVITGSLGIFRSKGTGYAGTLDNKKYTYTGAGKGWQPATTADTLFLNADDVNVCAYYPYNTNYQEATAIPLYSGEYTAAFHDPNDLCYDINRPVNAVRRATTFEMKHALSLLELRISKEAGYQGDCRITSISIINPELITRSAIDITTGTYAAVPTKGTLTYNPGTDAGGLLIGNTAVTTGALLVPFTPTADGLIIAFTVNGMPLEADIPTTCIARLEAGHRYSVKVTMKATAMGVTGVDMLPWDEVGVGGDDYTWYPVEEEKDPIDLSLPFVFAPANLRMLANGSYVFAPQQGYYSGIQGVAYDAAAGGDYFCWNTLTPAMTTGNAGTLWNEALDPCRKVKGGEWYTPAKSQLQVLIDMYTGKNAVWGTYMMSNNVTVNGMYFGVSDVPSPTEQDKYLFLPAAGNRNPTSNRWNDVGAYGNYWCSDLDGVDGWDVGFINVNCAFWPHDRNFGFSVRCVKDKPGRR